MMAKIESHRLSWIRNNQSSIKAEKYKIIVDALSNDAEVTPGRLTILPPTIYGSPRCQGVLGCHGLGKNQRKTNFFLTFTCNPRWPEIANSIFKG